MARPPEYSLAWEHFKKVLFLEQSGEIQEAAAALSSIDGNFFQDWFDTHAQNSGVWRSKAIGVHQSIPQVAKDSLRDFQKLEISILTRDNFRCRYCANTVFQRKRLRGIKRNLGDPVFPIGRRNRNCHGLYLLSAASLDHVYPHSFGGRTIPENLVTSCWPCNFGKSSYTLEQVGLIDPRSRDPLPLELPAEILLGASNAR